MTKNTDLSHLFINLKGSKTKREDWITLAKRCESVVKNSKSTQEAAKKAGVSYQLMRSAISLLKLPPEVQSLIKDGKILFDAAQRINTIKNPKRQTEVARTIIGLTSHQQREVIQYAKKFPEAKLSDYKNRLMKPREIEKLNVAIIPLKEEFFNPVKQESKKRGISIEKLLVTIIENWVRSEMK